MSKEEYIALELTKLCFNERKIANKEHISVAYKYFLEQISNDKKTEVGNK